MIPSACSIISADTFEWMSSWTMTGAAPTARRTARRMAPSASSSPSATMEPCSSSSTPSMPPAPAIRSTSSRTTAAKSADGSGPPGCASQ